MTTLELQARRDIERLRQLYAIATDSLGRGDDPTLVARGQSIYRRIFTTNADISTSGSTTPLHGTGPDAWATIAMNALSRYAATQHLLGTQIVTLEDLEGTGDPPTVVSGRGHMTTYLHAWHATATPDLRLVLGTYEDDVVYTPKAGWQITRMVLVHQAGDERLMGQRDATETT